MVCLGAIGKAECEAGPSQHPSASHPWSPERYHNAVNHCNSGAQVAPDNQDVAHKSFPQPVWEPHAQGAGSVL